MTSKAPPAIWHEAWTDPRAVSFHSGMHAASCEKRTRIIRDTHAFFVREINFIIRTFSVTDHHSSPVARPKFPFPDRFKTDEKGKFGQLLNQQSSLPLFGQIRKKHGGESETTDYQQTRVVERDSWYRHAEIEFYSSPVESLSILCIFAIYSLRVRASEAVRSV